MPPVNVTVVGLGEIGLPVLEAINRGSEGYEPAVLGVDIDEKKIERLRAKGLPVTTTLPYTDGIFIICVYTTDQVLDVFRRITYTERIKPDLISIESTISPIAAPQIQKLAKEFNVPTVLFPHRYNPGDPEHHVFNLNRVMGCVNDESMEIALDFYAHFMDPSNITIVPFAIAALAKITENAYRFMEIALAELIKMNCDEVGVDFDNLRKAVNTKWNIDVKEARDGIGGTCLPKDMDLFIDFMRRDHTFGSIFSMLKKIDKRYSDSNNPIVYD